MAVSVKVISHRKEIESAIDKDLLKKIRDVGILVENQAKENVDQLPPAHPQVRFGDLRSSITHKIEQTDNSYVAVIGTPKIYGKYLELGTINMPSYAWLFPAIEESQGEIKHILGQKGFSAGLQTDLGDDVYSESKNF